MATVSAGQIGFTPDLGLLPFSDHYDTTKNSLVVIVDIADLTVSGAALDPPNKGPKELHIEINSTVYTIPTAVWRRFHPGRKKTIYWQDGSGNTGSFKFYAEAPAVF